ncbi:unnamed protein product [Macrosiphum euphorbiae]|uniref:Uncharacterized protein n=1 Tax=Macrosiphum euphorbiae TaxID=13131 RepID=A0AAV0WWT8_9HEMI|nr:unnamed protein product [Macrosiphum euphorbiae]
MSKVKTLTIEVSLDSLVPSEPYQLPLFINFPNNMQVPCFIRSHIFFDCNKVDYSNIHSFISNFDWPSTLSALSLDSAFNTLYDPFHRAVLRFVPMHYFRQSTYPIWFTEKLKEILFFFKKDTCKI